MAIGFRGPRIIAATLVWAALTVAAASAGAAAGEHEWWGHVAGGVTDAGLVVGADVRWLRNVSDFWALGAALQDRHDLDGDGSSAALAHARLIIDALTWVPSLALSAGPAWDWTAARVDATWRVEGALAWRPERAWGLQGWIAVESMLRNGQEPVWLIGLGYGCFDGAAGALDL